MTIPYTENTAWADNVGGGTPITAAKLNNVEQGITDAHLMPAVRVTHNTTQSISHATETTLAFNTERFDQVGGASSNQHDTVTNNSRLTCRFAGIYLIAANVNWPSGTNALRQCRIRLNGTTYIADDVRPAEPTFTACDHNMSTLYQLAVNDYVEVRVAQNSGGALVITSQANFSPEFMMVRVA